MSKESKEFRVFIAIPISEKLSDFFYQTAQKIQTESSYRITPRNNMHITVLFIGNIAKVSVKKLQLRIDKELNGFSPFILNLKDIRFAPSRRPYMLWATFNQHQTFLSLHKKIWQACDNLDSYKKPLPHVTLARFRFLSPTTIKENSFDTIKAELTVREIVMYRSVLKPTGAEYSVLKRFKLTKI